MKKQIHSKYYAKFVKQVFNTDAHNKPKTDNYQGKVQRGKCHSRISSILSIFLTHGATISFSWWHCASLQINTTFNLILWYIMVNIKSPPKSAPLQTNETWKLAFFHDASKYFIFLWRFSLTCYRLFDNTCQGPTCGPLAGHGTPRVVPLRVANLRCTMSSTPRIATHPVFQPVCPASWRNICQDAIVPFFLEKTW